jgi:hypothetical protein
MEKYHIDFVNSLLIFRCRYARLLGSFGPQQSNHEIDDPYGLEFDAYKNAASDILACIPGVIDYIRDRLNPKAR